MDPSSEAADLNGVLGEPVTPEELVLRGNLLGQALPPSYVVAVRLMSRIGEPDLLLTAWDMADALEEIATDDADVETRGVLPFARTAEGLYSRGVRGQGKSVRAR